jgi:hypothetical protein
MISKSYKKIILAVAFIGSINSVAGIKTGSVYANAEEGKYIFMSRMFEVEPTLPMSDEKRDITTRGIKLAIAYLAVAKIASADLTKADVNLAGANKIVNSQINTKLHLGAIAVITALSSYYLNKYYYDDRKEIMYADNLVKFIENWDEYKLYTPEEFHPMFEELTTFDEATIRKRSLEVTKTVEHVLSHHFAEHNYYNSFGKKSGSKDSTDILSKFLGAAKTVFGSF